MKNPKHTQGPWTIKAAGRREDGTPTSYEISSAKWECLAAVYGSEDPNDDEEYQGLGNAKLIAAAPELFYACEMAYRMLCESGPDQPASKAVQRIIHDTIKNRLEQAMRKAKE